MGGADDRLSSARWQATREDGLPHGFCRQRSQVTVCGTAALCQSTCPPLSAGMGGADDRFSSSARWQATRNDGLPHGFCRQRSQGTACGTAALCQSTCPPLSAGMGGADDRFSSSATRQATRNDGLPHGTRHWLFSWSCLLSALDRHVARGGSWNWPLERLGSALDFTGIRAARDCRFAGWRPAGHGGEKSTPLTYLYSEIQTNRTIGVLMPESVMCLRVFSLTSGSR
jgi:hypothetical protein